MKLNRFTLKNGLRVIHLKKPIESVSLVISVKVGYMNEKEKELGVSHLLEHLLFDGTKNYPTEFIFNEAAEHIGGRINGTTEEYLTSFEIKSSKENFVESVKLLSDLIQNPLFLKENFFKEKKIIESELLSRRDLYKKNPVKTVLYSYLNGLDELKRINKEIKKIDSLNEELTRAHFKNYYAPKNMALGIVGNPPKLKKTLEEFFNKKNNHLKETTLPSFIYPPHSIKRIKDTEEVRSIFFTWFGPGMFSKEKAVFEVCAKIVAKGKNGVVKAIRFDEGLAYEVDAFLNDDERKGAFIVVVKTNKKNMSKVEKIVKEKVLGLRNVTQKEVDVAKKSVLAENILSIENYLEVARSISGAELFNQKTVFEGFFDEIKRVSLRDVKKFAEKYLGEEFVLITSK